MASCAVPGFMPPVSWKNMILVDGAILNILPVQPVKAVGADLVIAVDVGSSPVRNCNLEDGIDTILRSMEIMSFHINSQDRHGIDILLEPEVKEIEWTDYPDYEELIRLGEKAAESKIKTIHEMLNYQLGKKVIQWPKKIYSLLTVPKKHCYSAKT